MAAKDRAPSKVEKKEEEKEEGEVSKRQLAFGAGSFLFMLVGLIRFLFWTNSLLRHGKEIVEWSLGRTSGGRVRS